MLQRLVMTGGLMLLALTAGCPRVVDDGLEENDTRDQATAIEFGQPIEARGVQSDDDVFVLSISPTDLDTPGVGRTLQLTFETLGGEVCPAFTLVGPGDQILYADQQPYCRSIADDPVAVPGASLTQTDTGFLLVAPVTDAGAYYITVRELGHADNIFDYIWQYRLTATLVE